jgi:hypothetical protein
MPAAQEQPIGLKEKKKPPLAQLEKNLKMKKQNNRLVKNLFD